MTKFETEKVKYRIMCSGELDGGKVKEIGFFVSSIRKKDAEAC